MEHIDEITVTCYTAIYESWVEMLGDEVANSIYKNPNMDWKDRKKGQNHELFKEHPDWVWVLEKCGEVIGFVTFKLYPDRNHGVIENNGIKPDHAGRGLGKFMYRYVLDYFREQGLKIAHVETGLDDPHIAARKAYEATGFDKSAPLILYWQNLSKNNPGSLPD
ncbi:MAG: GNAT family N-acetyltransferase [Candidatus Thorarchaeota archaeon]|jgi:RimJ/RimL family protein N-acetyltransferase